MLQSRLRFVRVKFNCAFLLIQKRLTFRPKYEIRCELSRCTVFQSIFGGRNQSFASIEHIVGPKPFGAYDSQSAQKICSLIIPTIFSVYYLLAG